MLTLEKLAGYNPEEELTDKIATVLDAAQEVGFEEPLDVVTVLANSEINDNGVNILDEKVASFTDGLTQEQADLIVEAGEFLAGEPLDKVASISLDLQANAESLIKVAEAMDYLEENNIDADSALLIAASAVDDYEFDKIASEAVNSGFTDYDFDKIAEVSEYLGGVDMSVLEAADMVKEAADAGETLGVLGKMKSKLSGAWNSTKGYAGSYKNALMGQGAGDLKKSIKADEEALAQAMKDGGNEAKLNEYKTNIDANKKALKDIRMSQGKAIAGTGLAAGAIGGAGAYAYNKRRR